MGSQLLPSLYSFQTIYGDTNSVLSGQIDSFGNLHGRTQNTWSSLTAKSQASKRSMISPPICTLKRIT
jgi:hypothetical protein